MKVKLTKAGHIKRTLHEMLQMAYLKHEDHASIHEPEYDLEEF
jgi:hypothetical protein